jgi:hypothetical protein
MYALGRRCCCGRDICNSCFLDVVQLISVFFKDTDTSPLADYGPAPPGPYSAG